MLLRPFIIEFDHLYRWDNGIQLRKRFTCKLDNPFPYRILD